MTKAKIILKPVELNQSKADKRKKWETSEIILSWEIPTFLTRCFFPHILMSERRWEFYQKLFLYLLKWLHGFYSSISYSGVSYWLNSGILKNPCIPRINPIWSWYMVLLMHCWILFSSILLRIFIRLYQWYWPIIFLFCVISLIFVSQWCWPHRVSSEVFIFLQFFWIASEW